MSHRMHPRTGFSYRVLRQVAREMRGQGATLAVIAKVLDVTKPAVSVWVRDLPCHRDVAARNNRQRVARKRIYPPGHSAFVQKLRNAGYPQAERVRLVAEAARSAR